MLNVNVDDGHANYAFKILATNGFSFHLSDRYSSMR